MMNLHLVVAADLLSAVDAILFTALVDTWAGEQDGAYAALVDTDAYSVRWLSFEEYLEYCVEVGA